MDITPGLDPMAQTRYHGGDDRRSTAIHALHRAGEQPGRGGPRRRIGQGRFGVDGAVKRASNRRVMKPRRGKRRRIERATRWCCS